MNTIKIEGIGELKNGIEKVTVCSEIPTGSVMRSTSMTVMMHIIGKISGNKDYLNNLAEIARWSIKKNNGEEDRKFKSNSNI